MNLAKLSITALLAGGLTLPAIFAPAQQYGNAQRSTFQPSQQNSTTFQPQQRSTFQPNPQTSTFQSNPQTSTFQSNQQDSSFQSTGATPGAAASPLGSMTYRDAIGARATLGWNAPTGTYQAPVPNTPQYQGVKPPASVQSIPQPGTTSQEPSSSYSPGSEYAPTPSSTGYQPPAASSEPESYGGYPAAPPGSPQAPTPTDAYTQSPFSAYTPGPAGATPPATPPSQMLPTVRADFEHARQNLRVRNFTDAAQWIKDAAARLDRAAATDPYNVASRDELLAARDNLNALAAEILRGRPFDYGRSLDRSLDTTVRAWTRFQADQDRAAAQPGAPRY